MMDVLIDTFTKLKYSLYIIFHPFDGFWDLKHEKRGSMKAAITLFALFALTVVMRRQLTSYLFNPHDPDYINIMKEAVIALLPYILWCISNWCFTTLMDGEGKMSDILIATAYALTPMTLLNIVLILISVVLSLEEASLYNLIMSASVLWTYFLIFIGMLITHQYTVKKSVLTTGLTIVGMGVIIFLGLLVSFLIQQVMGFSIEVYREITFRINE